MTISQLYTPDSHLLQFYNDVHHKVLHRAFNKELQFPVSGDSYGTYKEQFALPRDGEDGSFSNGQGCIEVAAPGANELFCGVKKGDEEYGKPYCTTTSLGHMCGLGCENLGVS